MISSPVLENVRWRDISGTLKHSSNHMPTNALSLGLRTVEASLYKKIKLYKQKAADIENCLLKRPEDWGRFQSEFNLEVNGIFEETMNFEKSNLMQGKADRVLKLKRLFKNRVRNLFVRGEYINWSLKKPYGYTGDYKIIDSIYMNRPQTSGFDRLFDNYFQMSSICAAVRNRKEDFKRLMLDAARDKKDKPFSVMDLASGSCRDLHELCQLKPSHVRNAHIECYDNDERAIGFSVKLLQGEKNIKFHKENALKIALAKDVVARIGNRFDYIYSTGLFDYLNDDLSVRLLSNLKKLLREAGTIAISDVRDKYRNPSVHFMEWVGDWDLVYRSDDDFRDIFIKAGFENSKIKSEYEQQGIMHYIIARS